MLLTIDNRTVGSIIYVLTGVLNISLAGANNSVPTTGLTPCIIIVGASLSEPLLDEFAGAFLWYIYL